MMTELTSNEIQLKTSNDDCKEQVSVLLHIIELLSEMAAKFPFSSSSTAHQELDELQKTWKLEDTHIPELRASIGRLHQLLQQESDSHSEQMQAVQHELYDNSIRIQTLEKALKKLHQKNQRLRQKSEQNKKSIAKQVKIFLQKTNEDEKRHQLFAHERILKLEGSNRSRCSSRDTDFSDADMVALQSPIMEEELSVTSSASSVSTSPSFVTDEGIATVRYSPARVEDEKMHNRQISHEQHLKFPQGTKIGLQFYKVQLEKAQRGILNDAIQNSTPTENALLPSKDTSAFSMNFNLNALRGNHHDYAYLVCGHYGFDSDLNMQPMLGARLVKVNGESVEKMTLDNIKAAIRCTKCEFFTLTFCNAMLTGKQKEILDNAVAVTCQQYSQRQQARPSSHVDASVECQGKQPVIICMHEEGTSRLSSFMNSARSMTSDTGRTCGGEESTPGIAAISPSMKNLYSILHGADSLKAEIVAVDESNAALSLVAEDGGEKQTPCVGNRFSSVLDSARKRALSENSIVADRLGCKDSVTSPPGRRGLYSILHGDDADQDTLDIMDVGQQAALSEDISYAEKGNQLSSLFSNVRSRTYSDSAVRGDLSSTEREGAPDRTNGKGFPSLVKGAQSQGNLDPVEATDIKTNKCGSPSRHKANSGDASTDKTPSSQKLMKSVGSKLKSLF